MPDAAPFACILCGKPVAIPVVCPGCSAVHYCSTAHLKAHRRSGHAPVDCRRFAAHLTSVPGLNAHPLFPWHPTAPQPSLCTLLEGLGVHRCGAWVRECHCRVGTPYGVDAPLLKELWASTRAATITRTYLAARLADWWGVPGGGELLTTPAAAAAAAGPTDWASYCRIRPLDPSSPLPVLLDAPLTAFWAVQRLRARAGGALPARLTVALVGAEKEVDQWPVLLELGALLPGTDVTVEIIGPEVPCWADGRAVTVPPADGATGALVLSFHQGYFDQVVENRLAPRGSVPDVVVGLNAGLGAYQTWLPSLAALKRWWSGGRAAPRVCLFTDYIAESVDIARRNLGALMGPGGGGLAAAAAAAGDAAFAAAIAPDMSGAVRISDAEVNPFRKPRWVAQATHRMPDCPNSFALWVEH